MTAFHAIDLILKKRDRIELSAEEIQWFVQGAASETIPPEQISAWLMAAWLNGLTPGERNALTQAMRFSGETFDTAPLGRFAIDKHSTGGVGDKTSFLIAPICASFGLAVPMISGRALGHTGGTLDKLESIPGYNTQLSLAEFASVIERCGCSIIGQTDNLDPADRVLYAMRDRTGTVESPHLICASIMSKKLAAGLNGLVLDVKFGSGAFLQDFDKARYLAALMVETGEAAGTRTVALMTAMDQPLGRMAGNWIELWESVELLEGKQPPHSADLLEISCTLAGWMLFIGSKAASPNEGIAFALQSLRNGKALDHFLRMVEAHGADPSLFANPAAFHKPACKRTFNATKSGYIASMDTRLVGWAVQRTGAGRERAGEPVDAHAGIKFLAKPGDKVTAAQPIATLYGSSPAHLDEAAALLTKAIHYSDAAPTIAPRIHSVPITAQNAVSYTKEPA
jgi:pyrimidine-nucleoside phosphorylase